MGSIWKVTVDDDERAVPNTSLCGPVAGAGYIWPAVGRRCIACKPELDVEGFAALESIPRERRWEIEVLLDGRRVPDAVYADEAFGVVEALVVPLVVVDAQLQTHRLRGRVQLRLPQPAGSRVP